MLGDVMSWFGSRPVIANPSSARLLGHGLGVKLCDEFADAAGDVVAGRSYCFAWPALGVG